MDTFRALVVDKAGDGVALGLQDWSADRLTAGEVTIRVEYSSINYKDGLAVRADGRVVRDYPLIPGIDLAGDRREQRRRPLWPRQTRCSRTATRSAWPTTAAWRRWRGCRPAGSCRCPAD